MSTRHAAQSRAVSSASTPEELGAFVKAQLANWARMIRDAGIEPQ